MASSIRSVASAFAIMRLLAVSGPLTLTGIGQELGLSPSSCLNLLRTLVDQGAVEREGRAKLYRLAPSWAETGLFDVSRDRAMAERLRAAMAQVAIEHEATVGLWKVSPGRRLQLIAHAVRQGFAIDEAATFTGVTSLAATVGEDHPAYLISASVFAGSRSPPELHALGTALKQAGKSGSAR